MQNLAKVVLFFFFTCKELFASHDITDRNFVIFIAFLCFFLIAFLIYFLIKNIKRKKELEELLNSQRKFDNTLLDTIPHLIYYKNIENEYLGCNDAFSDFLGRSKSYIVGKKSTDFFQKEMLKNSLIADEYLIDNGGTRTEERTFIDFRGNTKHFVVTKSAFENIDGTIGGIVGVMDDITERTNQKQFLIQQSKLAEMGDMIAAIAHQWHEPLVDLSSIIQDVKYSYKNKTLNDEEVDEFVDEAMKQIQYMSKTLKDFRDFLKPSTQKTVFLVNTSIDKLFEIIKRQINYSYIKLEVCYHPQFANITIYGYENEFMQVLLNIINNARKKIVEKFKNEEDKKGEIKIDIWQEYDTTFLSIRDNAGGVRGEILKHMFDPYFSTKINGTGLGLYMAKVIIEDKMNGKISASSDIDSVTFTIEVPSKSTKIDLE